MTVLSLVKWSVVMVWCDQLDTPHDKFCICICPHRHWYLFINSKPPFARKAKEVAVELSNFELHFLDHASYVDTTSLQRMDACAITTAWGDENRRKGFLPPSVQRKIKAAAQAHGVLSADELDAILSE